MTLCIDILHVNIDIIITIGNIFQITNKFWQYTYHGFVISVVVHNHLCATSEMVINILFDIIPCCVQYNRLVHAWGSNVWLYIRPYNTNLRTFFIIYGYIFNNFHVMHIFFKVKCVKFVSIWLIIKPSHYHHEV